MKLTIVGCAGSYPGPESASSCYLLEHDGYRLLIDLGSGALGPLQRHLDLRDVDAVLLSHLHADHCFDLSGFYVVSKYHPSGALPTIPVYAPQGAGPFLASSYGRSEGLQMSDQFDFRTFVDGELVQLGPFSILPRLVDHPVEAYGMRITAGGRVLAYSGDSAPTPVLDDIALGADVFLCEASFVESGVNPPGLHLTGAEAGDYAKRGGVGRMLVTHIPAWTDRDEVASDVRSTFDGDHVLVESGQVYDV